MRHLATGVRWAFCLLLCLCILPAGCKGPDMGPSPTELAQSQFQAGDYARAQATAARAAVTAGGTQRGLANYIAGISAYRLDNMTTAERYLRVAAQSRDASLAADASSTLGLIYSRNGRYAEAAAAFQRGAGLQDGEDKAQAYFYAGVAQQKLGQWPQARTSLLLARRSTRDPGFVQRIDEQLSVTGYTVQVGAFANRSNADQLAAKYAGRAASSNLGSVIVTPSVDSRGRPMNLVQVGRYATFGAANSARSQLGDFNAVIVPLQR